MKQNNPIRYHQQAKLCLPNKTFTISVKSELQKYKSNDSLQIIKDHTSQIQLQKYISQPRLCASKPKTVHSRFQKPRIRLRSEMETNEYQKQQKLTQKPQTKEPNQHAQNNNGSWFESCINIFHQKQSYQIYMSPSSVLSNQAIEKNYKQQLEKNKNFRQDLNKRNKFR